MRKLFLAAVLLLALPALAFADPKPALRAEPQSGSACGTGLPATQHCVVLNFTASTSAAGCSSAATPPCAFGYNVFVGTAAGGESATPANSSPIAGTSYTYLVTLGSSPVTYYFTVGATETLGTVTTTSVTNSNEVSGAFPGIPAAPTGATAAAH